MKPLRALFTAASVSVLAACGGGDDGGTTPPPPPAASIALSLSATSGSVQAGANTSVTATVARTNFTGAVSVAVSGAPTGVTTNVTSAGDAHTVAITVAATTTPGPYSLTITASGTGVTSASATYALTVTPRPSIALALSPTSASVQQGGNTTFTATVTPTNFTGATSVAITGAPTGVTTTVTTAGNTHTVAVAVAASAATGASTLTATASGTGVTSVTANFALTVTQAPTASSIALSANPTTVNVTAGGANGTTTITIARTNFTGDVTLAAAGLPAGATAAFSPATTAGTTSTLTFTVGAAVTAGTYPIAISGSGTGVTTASTQVSLVVAAQASSIALSATSVSVQQGASGNSTVTITRTNFTGAVTLALTGVPNGVTPTITSSPTTQNSATVAFAVGAAVAIGNYTVTVTGSGTGVANATTTLTLSVTQGSTGGGNVTLSFCGATSDIPIWLAAQNGTGAWAQVTAGANNTYSFNVTSTGGVAWVTQNGTNDFDLTIYYGAAGELNGYSNQLCISPTLKTVTGSVAGVGATDQVSVSFGGRSPTTAPTAASPNFTITGVPDGLRDLIGTRTVINLMTGTFTVNKIFLKRGLNPANNASVGAVDFGGADAFDPDTKQVTINGGAAGEQFVASTSFSTSNGSAAALGTSIPGAGNVFSYAGIPSARTQAGDLHIVTASALTLNNFTPVSGRSVANLFRVAADVTVTLGPALSTATVTTAATVGTHARLRLQLARQSEYGDFWLVSYGQGTTSLVRSTTILVTAAGAGAGSTLDLTVPDFSTVSGWQNLWGLQTGAAVTGVVTANGWVLGGGNQAEGTVTRSALRFLSHTP